MAYLAYRPLATLLYISAPTNSHHHRDSPPHYPLKYTHLRIHSKIGITSLKQKTLLILCLRCCTSHRDRIFLLI